jgi:DNA repair ATPase RecN
MNGKICVAIRSLNMIDRLELNNFQKHKKINIEFKKGLNIIVGPSDAGKSAIFRSLDFILFNGAKKSNIITNGQKQTEVIIDIDDMCVRRIKGSNTNKYYLDDMEFKAFGTKPPKEISDIINLGDVNIQDQHSKPFLISETPGEVAKYLNNLINIDTIDKLNSVFISKQKKIKNNIKLVREDYEDIKKTYDKNKTLLGKLKIRFIDLEDRSRLKEKKQEEVETLIDLIDQYEDNSKIFTDRHSELKKEYSRISRYYNKVLELGDKMYILRKIVNKKPG